MALKIKTEVDIKASPEVVWKFLMDVNNMKDWMTGFVSCETISGKPEEPGSKHRMVFNEKGREMVFIETVHSVIPKEEYTFTLSHESMSSRNQTVLESVDGLTTKVIQHAAIQSRSLLFSLLLPFLKSATRNRMKRDLNKLKELIEQKG